MCIRSMDYRPNADSRITRITAVAIDTSIIKKTLLYVEDLGECSPCLIFIFIRGSSKGVKAISKALTNIINP